MVLEYKVPECSLKWKSALACKLPPILEPDSTVHVEWCLSLEASLKLRTGLCLPVPRRLHSLKHVSLHRLAKGGIDSGGMRAHPRVLSVGKICLKLVLLLFLVFSFTFGPALSRSWLP